MDITPILDSLHLEHTPPKAIISSDGGADNRAFPMIQFSVTLRRSKDGPIIYQGTYSDGIGHIKPLKPSMMSQYPALRQYLNNPMMHPPIDPQALKEWTALARRQRTAPDKLDVFFIAMQEGSAYFDAMTFSEWASEYGYSDDSIKAKGIYDTCVQIGMQIKRAFPDDTMLQALRDWASDY